MVRERSFGSDVEFCEWMRNCNDLPSYGKDFGFVATDTDLVVHRYLTSVDSIGTREVQGLMQIEVKTRMGKPQPSQMDTLSKLNLFADEKVVSGVYVRFFGVYILVLQNTTPDNSSHIWWVKIPKGKFYSDPKLSVIKQIDRGCLIDILRFERHPDNLEKLPFRRHHKTQDIYVDELTPLGFTVERRITKRS